MSLVIRNVVPGALLFIASASKKKGLVWTFACAFRATSSRTANTNLAINMTCNTVRNLSGGIGSGEIAYFWAITFMR